MSRSASTGQPVRKVVSKVRCAIYTRKSSEEGLDMEFNSLDAQREACAAYVLSQRPEGWIAVADRYDDGGISGGTLERPALKRLIADIELGKVDVVVVYKIDRLSRSLMDFAKLVDVFERRGVIGTAPPLFAAFSPYQGDTSGVGLTTGLVDFATGRYSIITAPGAGTEAEVRVFAYPLLKALAGAPAPTAEHGGAPHGGPGGPVLNSRFKPFGDGYTGGVSLATGWMAGEFGGAQNIVTGQLAGDGTVKVFSSGSSLDGGPSLYLHSPVEHGRGATFREIASFAPFDGGAGVRVAATATTAGADLLVSGVSADKTAKVAKFGFRRADAAANTVAPVPLGDVTTVDGGAPAALGGD